MPSPNPSRRLRTAALRALFVLSSIGASAARAEEVVIIVNRANANTVDAAFVQRVYVGAVKGWPDGVAVLVLDQPEGSEAREVFCNTVLKKSVGNVKAIWSQHIFTGKGMPPRVASPDDAIKQAVAANVGAIGYIRASQLDATVKALGR